MSLFRFVLFVAGVAAAAEAAEIGDDVAIALPPFLVEETAKGPPWRHGEAMGFEILSRCRDQTTRRVVEAHFRLHALLSELLPPHLRLQFSVKPTLILYDEELQPASSREVIQKMLEAGPGSGGDEYPRPMGGRGFNAPIPQRRYSFLPNLRLWDRDAMAVFMIVRRDDFDAARLKLTYDYVRYLVLGRLPALPVWFSAGFLNLYQTATYEGDRLSLEPLLGMPQPSPETAQITGSAELPVGPLTELFSPAVPPGSSPIAYEFARLSSEHAVRAWQAYAALFVRWALHADGRSHRQALWNLVERTATLGQSESLFAECFGFDYATARLRLSAYLPTAVGKTAVFRLDRSVKLQPFGLSNASDAQIARIKGDWERMEVPYVRGISPALAPKYLELARRTMKRAYDRDCRDPGLLAAMGLCEVDAGNDAAALEYLESAANIGTLRPRACYELARLRLAEHQARLSLPARQLDARQTAEVLRPLFAARGQLPPLVEVYELIAEAWSHCAFAPSHAHLAVLDEGVRLFPRRSSLLLRSAELYLRHGFRETADLLVQLGLRTADNNEARAKFELLQRQLSK